MVCRLCETELGLLRTEEPYARERDGMGLEGWAVVGDGTAECSSLDDMDSRGGLELDVRLEYEETQESVQKLMGQSPDTIRRLRTNGLHAARTILCPTNLCTSSLLLIRCSVHHLHWLSVPLVVVSAWICVIYDWRVSHSACCQLCPLCPLCPLCQLCQEREMILQAEIRRVALNFIDGIMVLRHWRVGVGVGVGGVG